MKVPPYLLLLILTTFALPTSGEDGILGTWRSAELNTGSTLQISFEEEAGKLAMKLWSSSGGKISESESEYETDISVEKAKAHSEDDSSLKIPIDFGFKEVIYEIFKTDSGLRVESIHQYTDDSGRESRNETLNFVRGFYSDAVTEGLGQGVPEEGWLGVWRNRDEGTRGIAQLLIHDVSPVMMTTWGIAGGELSPKRGCYVELPLDSKEASSLKRKSSVEASYDHGWAKQTFDMKIHEDGITLVSHMDYTDPERNDQTHEYEFVRGTWDYQ